MLYFQKYKDYNNWPFNRGCHKSSSRWHLKVNWEIEKFTKKHDIQGIWNNDMSSIFLFFNWLNLNSVFSVLIQEGAKKIARSTLMIYAQQNHVRTMRHVQETSHHTSVHVYKASRVTSVKSTLMTVWIILVENMETAMTKLVDITVNVYQVSCFLYNFWDVGQLSCMRCRCSPPERYQTMQYLTE